MKSAAQQIPRRADWLLLGMGMLLVAGGGACQAAEAALKTSPAWAVAPDCKRAGQQLQRQPACAMGRSVFLVAWSDGNRQAERPTADIYCARIEPGTGRCLDPAGVRVCASADLQEWPAVAFDGTNFLVVWQDLRNGTDYDIYAARVSETGQVLDPDGFPVIQRPANQARPALGFAAGQYLVAWMDARQCPVYGLYAARVSTDGRVLDPDGKPLDTESQAQVDKVRPSGPTWLGDRGYWWERLASRFQPAIATQGDRHLVAFLREMHANKTTGQALLVDAASGAVIRSAARLAGEPRDRLAPCATPDGWVVAFDQWMSGWSPSARLAALRLDASLQPRDSIRESENKPGPLPDAALMDLQKLVAGDGATYQQGKGHFAFWQAATAWNGRHVVVAMDYGWRTKGKPNDLNHAIVAARLSAAEGRFMEETPLVTASGGSATGVSVQNPVLAAGPNGEVLLVYEQDEGIGKLGLRACWLREVTPP